MATESDSSVYRPSQPVSAQEFVAELRRLRAQVGLPSFRDLSRVAERRAATADGRRSEALPPSTTSEILAGKRLPRMPRLEFVESYVAACLATANIEERLIDTEVARWRGLWRSLAQHEEPDRSTVVEVPARFEWIRARQRRWIVWSALVATFVAGIGTGVAGSRLLVDQQPRTVATGTGVTGASGSADESCPAPVGAVAPTGRDLLGVPASPSTTGTRAATWWANNADDMQLLHSDGRAFRVAVRGGTARPADLIIVRSDVPLSKGRSYALAFTATVDRPTTIRVRVQDSAPPHYESSYMKDLRASTVACRHHYQFVAAKTSDRSEITFQAGGNDHDFELRVSDVVFVEQDA